MTSVTDVCFLGYGLHPPWSEGTRVLTRDQMRALAIQGGLTVRGFSTYRRGDRRATDLNLSYVSESVVGDIVEARGGYRYNFDLPMIARLMWRVGIDLARRGPDVLHVGFASHTLFSLLNDVAGDAAVVAQTFGGLEHRELLALFETPSRIDAYVSTTDEDLNVLDSLGVPREKLYKLRPAVFIDEFGVDDELRARSLFDLSPDAYVVGYFGNVNEVRFPYSFAQKLNRLAEAEDVEVLVVTKQIENRDVRELENLTVVSEHLSESNKRLAYAAADVWTFPFQFDDAKSAPVIDPPLTVLESMASGKPVVATDILSLGEAIEDGKNGRLVHPGDLDALVQIIEELWTDLEERRRLGRNARETVESSYSPAVVAEELLSIYREAIERARD